MAYVADTLHRLYRPGRTITMTSNDARVGRLQRRLVEKPKLKQRAHIDQTIAWPVPHACAQPYHLGRGSYGQPVHRLPWLIGAHQHGCLCPGDICAPCFEFVLVEKRTLTDFSFQNVENI